jgi:predicted ester cyclase
MNLQELMKKDRRVMEDVLCNNNMDAMSETHTTDLIIHAFPFPDLKGLEACNQTLGGLFQGFSDRRVEWGDSVCENNTIAEQLTIRMKHTGVNPMFSVPPTNKEVFMKGSVFLHVKNDKIVVEFQYLDLLGFLQQLGIVPPMGQK